jgi:hypothetical protein
MCWRKNEAVADGVADRLLVKSAPRSPRRKAEAIMAEEEVVEAIMAEAIMALWQKQQWQRCTWRRRRQWRRQRQGKGKKPCEWNSTGDVNQFSF